MTLKDWYRTIYRTMIGVAAIFDGAETRRRAELCLLTSLVIAAISLIATPFYFVFLKSSLNLFIGIAYTILTACTPLLMRFTRSQPIAAHYFLFLLLSVIAFFCVLMGGISSPIICCLFVVPFHALNMLGQRGMYAWIGVAFLVVIGFVMLHTGGITLLPVIPLAAPVVVCVSFFIVVGTVSIIVKIADDQRLEQYHAVLYEQERVQMANLELDAVNERLTVQNSQLLAMNDEKNSMMGILAHDLKNPLSNILFFSEVLEHRKEKNLAEPEITRYATMMHDSATRMNALIQNLLNVHSLESGATVLHLKILSLPAFVQAAMLSQQARALAKNITFELSVSDETISVNADETLLAQVLDNLLSNAVKYSFAKSVVRVSISTSHHASGEAVRVAIDNEGEGIAPDDMPKLFQKFSRLRSKPTGGEDSTGLGLAIVKHCVERLGGRVWCESEYGKGVTFIVELPTLEASAATMDKPTTRII
jgi:signal transduction histidine kinase